MTTPPIPTNQRTRSGSTWTDPRIILAALSLISLTLFSAQDRAENKPVQILTKKAQKQQIVARAYFPPLDDERSPVEQRQLEESVVRGLPRARGPNAFKKGHGSGNDAAVTAHISSEIAPACRGLFKRHAEVDARLRTGALSLEDIQKHETYPSELREDLALLRKLRGKEDIAVLRHWEGILERLGDRAGL